MQEQSQAERALMLSKKKLERDFDTQERQDKVASMKRMRAYQKEKMLGKIQADTQKALRLKAEKQQLQEERKQQNMIASHQKQKLMETMERMKTSKGWAALSKGGGPSRSRTSSACHKHWRGQKNRKTRTHTLGAAGAGRGPASRHSRRPPPWAVSGVARGATVNRCFVVSAPQWVVKCFQ